MYWWLTSNYENIRNLSGGDLRDGLNLDILGSIPCPIVELDEQSAIAAFLDKETAKIDGLVQQQKRLIELLKEKRQAVISHAVTKGLDPNAPMNESGVEWLGEMPAHWQVRKLGSTSKLQSGYAFSSSDFGDEGIPVVRMNNLNRGMLDLSEAVRIPEASCNTKSAIRSGDLLWGMSGSVGDTGSLGNHAVVNSSDLPCQLSNSPTLTKQIMDAIIDALAAHESLSKQALGSERVREGLKDILLGPGRLYEALRAQSGADELA